MLTYSGLLLFAFVLGAYCGSRPASLPVNLTDSLPSAFLPSRRQRRAWFKERR